MSHPVSREDQRALAVWAAECAEHVLPYFEARFPEDDRPRRAIEGCRAWVRTGVFRMADVRGDSLAAHAASREAEADSPARFAARAAGQAVATAHVPSHAIGVVRSQGRGRGGRDRRAGVAVRAPSATPPRFHPAAFRGEAGTRESVAVPAPVGIRVLTHLSSLTVFPMRARTAVPLLCTMLFPVLLSGADGLGRGPDPLCEAGAGVDTGAWEPIRSGVFSFRVPPGYRQQKGLSIDSDFRKWYSPGGQGLTTDYGIYNGPFEKGPHRPMREPIIECARGDGTAAPQLVVYRTVEKRYAVGLYWVVSEARRLRPQRGPVVEPETLWLEAVSPREEHLPELLAIARSVRLLPD